MKNIKECEAIWEKVLKLGKNEVWDTGGGNRRQEEHFENLLKKLAKKRKH